jgi:hypothetical protein
MIDELELLRHYMDSAPRPASVDLEEARLRLNSEMELETTTTAPTKAATRIPGVSNLRFRFKRPVVALLSMAAALHREPLKNLDPIDRAAVMRASASSVFEELRTEIVSATSESTEAANTDAETLQLRHHRSTRPLVAITALAAIALVASVLVINGGTSPKAVAGHGRQADSPSSSGNSNTQLPHVRTGTWTLADDLLNGTWQQNPTGGPPPGSLSCPTASICYAMSGKYASSVQNAPLLSESLYVSTNSGATWIPRLMPNGFDPTSPLACSSETNCAAGGLDAGRAVLVTTLDGGLSFAMHQLPSGAGQLDTLSCPSTTFCAGLAAHTGQLDQGTTNATFVSTSDHGLTFRTSAILPGDSMEALTCSSNQDCTAVGWSNALGPDDWTAGVAAMTADGGTTWDAGVLPTGFGIDSSSLSCANATRCWVTGSIDIPFQNPSQCESTPGFAGNSPSATSTTGRQSPAVALVATAEGAAATSAAQKAADGGDVTCIGQGQMASDIAFTDDGGLTWIPDQMPDDVPEPMLGDISCPTVTQCWAAGSSNLPVVGHSGGTPVLLGTTDGGITWSKVTFSAPTGAPNYDDQSYLTMAGVDCPSAGDCVAIGTGAVSAPSVPTYSLIAAGSR